MVRKFQEPIPEEQLLKDLEKYRIRAIALGATDAKIIPSDAVIIDERVRAKCLYPKCESYGTNANCPPYAPGLEEIRELVKRYRYAILFKLVTPPEALAGPIAKKTQSATPYGLKRHEIVGILEAEAFQDGYHLALGFGGGSCKGYFCPTQECTAIKVGQGCRHPLKARAAMEAMGMDVYTMIKRVGWDIYPIGERTPPSEVPFGLLVGIVLIQ
jgi:predicted metal-binding protein